jgi:hypothetical protein
MNSLIQAAKQRVKAAEQNILSYEAQKILSRMRITHTRQVFSAGVIHFYWDASQFKVNQKFVAFVLEKVGHKPKVPSLNDAHSYEFTNNRVDVLVCPAFGILSIKEVDPKAVKSSSDEEMDFHEYDDYDQWVSEAKKHWPNARHNKKGEPGYTPGYGEEEDEEFVDGEDMQADIVAVWSSEDQSGWIMYAV